MTLLRKRYRVEGLGVERLMDTYRKKGIALFGVRRCGSRGAVFSCAAASGAQVETEARALGFSLECLPPNGALRGLRLARRRIDLWLLALAFAVLLILAMQFVWRITVTGAGVYRGEVRAVLREMGIRPGILRAGIDTAGLCDALLYRLPRIAWARVSVKGAALRVEIVQGVPAPAVEQNGAAGDIVAACDGVILRIDVYSGSAAVKPGDAVRAGDVLIRGQERQSLDGAVRAVRARGAVTAQVGAQAAADVSLLEIRSLPTGRTALQRAFASPWLRYAFDPAPDYLTADVISERVPLGGAWFPVWYEKTAYSEIALERAARSEEDARAEAGRLAWQRLLLLCGGSDEMIDNFINYSMIEGDTIRATAAALLKRQIGVFSPHTE